MPPLIQCIHLFKSFGSHRLFVDISLSIHYGERVALIGENGAGKTTFLQLLAGTILSDAGHVKTTPHLTIGHLQQELSYPLTTSVNDYLKEDSLIDIEQEMRSCLESQKLNEWAELHERYEQLGGYKQLPIEQILKGLKLDTSLLDLSMAALSSGQKVRFALAKALINNPDLLLLDEPTNHLDQDMVDWLKQILRMRKGATVLISHDRAFLNDTCNHLIEVKNGTLSCYTGNYDAYLEEQKKILGKTMKAYEDQEHEKVLLKQKIKAITFSKSKAAMPTDRNIMAYDHKGGNHQKSLQRNLDVLKARLAELEANSLPHPKPKGIKGLYFSPTPLNSSIVMELQNLSKTFESKVLFSNLNKVLRKGDRILLTGPNGSGKTTLLLCMARLLTPDSGEIRYTPSAKIAYLDQEVQLLPMDQTPLQYFESHFHLSEESLRSELHKAAIGGSDLLKRPFATLSVGQRKRFMLLSLVLQKPNVLLLDEPTNHLDLLSMEALETALLNFEGALLAVSHDATFIKKIATDTWSLV